MHRELNVLVTGGAGFIGSHLVDRLVNSGYNVKVLDNLSTGNLSNIQSHIDNGKIEFVEGDITNLEQVKACISGIDAVFHLAAQISVPLSVKNPKFTYETNVNGTINMLSALANKNPQGKFIFISSCAVYGEPQYLPVDEKHPTNPISPYAESKLLGEYYTLGFHQNKLLKTAALRFFNVYGVRQGLNDYSGVITKFIDRVKQNQPLTIYGDGTQTRDFVHISNIVDAIVACLENPNAEGQVFNIGTGKALTIEDLAKSLISLSGASSTINHAPPREGDIKFSYANISKAASLLNYMPTMQLSTGLQELLAAATSLNPQ
ncbi:MAG: SDR family NAD(P)-dependent oxidoreductase [Candidatus Bathyarchaeia archaeon]|jgi:UDP-glucose 4-epimerase